MARQRRTTPLEALLERRTQTFEVAANAGPSISDLGTATITELEPRGRDLWVERLESDESIVLTLRGSATASNIEQVTLIFGIASQAKKHILIDFAATHAVDARFLGLLFMLRKLLKEHGASLTIEGVSSHLERIFRLHGASFMLLPDDCA